mmetsp:Transcript_27142/g.75870  ORF Transcript_27142/g.75870 Transcript_27142/m.75870 type:complete len:292 (-) Transcript_27142:980-1855(-)
MLLDLVQTILSVLPQPQSQQLILRLEKFCLERFVDELTRGPGLKGGVEMLRVSLEQVVQPCKKRRERKISFPLSHLLLLLPLHLRLLLLHLRPRNRFRPPAFVRGRAPGMKAGGSRTQHRRVLMRGGVFMDLHPVPLRKLLPQKCSLLRGRRSTTLLQWGGRLPPPRPHLHHVEHSSPRFLPRLSRRYAPQGAFEQAQLALRGRLRSVAGLTGRAGLSRVAQDTLAYHLWSKINKLSLPRRPPLALSASLGNRRARGRNALHWRCHGTPHTAQRTHARWLWGHTTHPGRGG